MLSSRVFLFRYILLALLPHGGQGLAVRNLKARLFKGPSNGPDFRCRLPDLDNGFALEYDGGGGAPGVGAGAGTKDVWARRSDSNVTSAAIVCIAGFAGSAALPEFPTCAQAGLNMNKAKKRITTRGGLNGNRTLL